MSDINTDNNQGTVRIDDGKNTVRLDDNDGTVRLDSGSGAVDNAVNFTDMGNMAGIMPQQNAKIDTGDSEKTGEVFTPGQIIEINNKRCEIESVISISSGEAVIYKVKIDGWPFVLKHYKINTPLSDNAKEVLKKIKFNQKEKIIKLSDFGRRYDQDYEIMEFAEGGTLDQYLKENGPIKDINKLMNIVGQINQGLEQLHDELKIIYQDLKPENIYFRDTQKTTLVLADFGISSVIEPGENSAKVTANATTVYAAPDLARIGNNKDARVGPPVDYFALGITMLHLWIGATPFQNIPEYERFRQIMEKDVAFPQDMPAECKTLIQGLIDPSSKSRWGSQHVKRWLAGESLEIEYRKTSITYESRMFNETENYASLQELAALMDKYPDKGKQCLYSDILTSWLQKAGDHFMLDDIKNIISTYAADKDAGLYLAIYKLDPTRPFITHGGKTCTDTVEIADAIQNESAYYMEELKKADAKLYLYFEAVEGANGKNIAEQLRKNFEEYSPKRALNIMYLKLQADGGRSITIGSKTYQEPEEIAAETDEGQIMAIKTAVCEEDSLFLVWLSDRSGGYFRSTGGFYSLETQDRFFLLSIFPFLSYKEFIKNWEQVAVSDLVSLINSSPGRFDLFKAYAAQGLPFKGQAAILEWRPTAMSYMAMFFKDLISDENVGLELIRFMYDNGADVNESSGSGSFPLIIAACFRNVTLVKFLLELGADPNKSDGGNNSLLYALGKNDDDDDEAARIAIAHILLDYNANPNSTDANGRIALFMATAFESNEKVDLVSHFLKAGANIHVKDKEGTTSLFIATFFSNTLNNKQPALEVMELLLKKGGKTETLLNNGNLSPLMQAAAQNDIEAAKLLLKYGAKKDFADKDGETAFIYAARNNHTQMKALVDPGFVFKFKSRLFSFIKTVVSILATVVVFFTMDILARIVLSLQLSHPVLLGTSILLSHLLSAYLLIVYLGLHEYLIRLRGTFNFIGRSIQYLVGIPIVFPLIVLLLQFITRFLPPNLMVALSLPAEMIIYQGNIKVMFICYILIMAGVMAIAMFVSKINEKFARKWQIYKRYAI